VYGRRSRWNQLWDRIKVSGFSSFGLVKPTDEQEACMKHGMRALSSRHCVCRNKDTWTSHADVGFEVLIAVVMKSCIFWNIAPCSPLKITDDSGNVSPPSAGPKNKPDSPACCLLHSDFLPGLFFDLEDGRVTFLRNVCWLSTNYMALYHRIRSAHIRIQPVRALISLFPPFHTNCVGCRSKGCCF
jgi:hypothetical protein